MNGNVYYQFLYQVFYNGIYHYLNQVYFSDWKTRQHLFLLQTFDIVSK